MSDAMTRNLPPMSADSTKVRLVVEVEGDRPIVELCKALRDAGAQVVGLALIGGDAATIACNGHAAG